MNKEDKKIQENLVNEMMKVSKTNPDVIIYMQSLMKCYEELEKENKDLQKKAELGEHYKHLYSEVKKQKDDVVNYIKYLIKRLEEFDIPKRKETGAFWYQVMGELEEILRMLGEIE